MPLSASCRDWSSSFIEQSRADKPFFFGVSGYTPCRALSVQDPQCRPPLCSETAPRAGHGLSCQQSFIARRPCFGTARERVRPNLKKSGIMDELPQVTKFQRRFGTRVDPGRTYVTMNRQSSQNFRNHSVETAHLFINFALKFLYWVY